MSSVRIQQSIEVFSNVGVRNTQTQLCPVSFLELCWMHGQSSAEVSASHACDGLSGLSGPQCVCFSELPEFSGAGCRAGLHLSHSSPQVPATVFFFPVLDSTHTHIHTPTFLFPGSTILGWEARREGGKVWKNRWDDWILSSDSSPWLDSSSSSEAWSCCRRSAWPYRKWWVWLRLSTFSWCWMILRMRSCILENTEMWFTVDWTGLSID